ncbi:MAG: phenylalanine--tRNA ligase beta subunit-related protein [bacterium]
MKIRIDQNLFRQFPDFCRGVVVANDMDNREEDKILMQELRDLEKRVYSDPSLKDYKNHLRITSWRKAFEKFGVNPNSQPPAIASLVKRALSGSPIPFINKLVTIFNIMSLENIVPCGGDDLTCTVGNLELGYSTGDEEYVPLGKPEIVEHPRPGEIIYHDGEKKVLCRAWCWRNSHVTRILQETTKVAINVDGLSPVSPEEISNITQILSSKVKQHCGGDVKTYLLSIANTEIEIDF